MSDLKYRFRWTGELVDLLQVHDPSASVRADAGHDIRCALMASVRHEDGRVGEVPFSTLTPVRAPRFAPPPSPARADERVASL